ncbi:MAG: hypothetical protein H6838_06195 [Planctomycetes bacterium]|nr:hypothetical protein [Planctomycetota bacterium]
MSGEHPRDDEPDFLDDDFVLEDDAAFGDLPEEKAPAKRPDGDLDELFEGAAPVQSEGSEGADDLDDELFAVDEPAASADDDGASAEEDPFAIDEADAGSIPFGTGPEEEAILFTDHTEGLDPTQSFTSGGEFAEGGPSRWDGEGLELEDEENLPAPGAGLSPHEVEEATADFEQELSSMMIEEEDDLVVDSEQDLELVDGPVPAQRAAQPELGSFDDEDLPTLEPIDEFEEFETAAAGADAHGLDPEGMSLVEDEPIDPEWAPLDEAALAQEAEEVENPYAAEYYAEDENPEEAEGHDLYVEDEPEVAEVVGGQRRGGRMLSMFASLAASLAILASGAVVVMRPEWFGLSVAPERVPSAQVTRPEIKVVAPTPTLPPMPAPVTAPTDPVEVPVTGTETAPVEPGPVTPIDNGPDPVTPAPTDPVTPADVPAPVEPTPQDNTTVATGPEPLPVVPVASPDPVTPVEKAFEDNWPVPVVAKGQDPKAVQSQLVRINDHVLLGDTIAMAPRPSQAVDGMVPGSRAFAQLINGNYFIGSVKTMNADTLTLKVDEGEVSIPVVTIARLTPLGSRDFEELQKMTTGSVRLTNNNRLVGSILSGIADDHVVLEFRSNRVMLPKSVIGDILEGQEQSDIRLDTTSEEEDWLRHLIERELGTGLGAPVTPKPPAAPQGAQPPAAPQGAQPIK